jgi:hypothetical protein
MGKNSEIRRRENENKKAALRKAGDFDISSPVNDEEFNESVLALASIILFDTPWRNEDGLRILKKLPVLRDIPLHCLGRECIYAKKCDVINGMHDDEILKLHGTNCRSEQVFGLETFARICDQLKVDPEQAIDILGVTDLVRAYIQKRRIDWQLALEGMISDEPIPLRDGSVTFSQREHPLLIAQERIQKQIDKLMQSLMASREQRLKADRDKAMKDSMYERLLDSVKKIEEESEILEADFDSID